MKKVATVIACATSLWAAPVCAGENPEENTAVTESAPQVTTSKSASPDEISVDNAAVDRAFAGGDLPRPEVRIRPHRYGLYFGIRAMNLKDPGYDPYSDSDAFVQNALSFSFSPMRTRPFSLHFLAEWNIGASSAYARGAQTDLLINRVALGIEGRWMPKSRFYLYAKVVPSAANIDAEIDDYALGGTLETNVWTFLLDTSAGAALRLGTAGKEPGRTVSFWLMMDWGYTFAKAAEMKFQPVDESDPTRRFGIINLPNFQVNGFVTRATFGLTF